MGCNGSVSFASVSSLCDPTSHLCSVSEYLNYGGKTTLPTTSRWISTQVGSVLPTCTNFGCGGFPTCSNAFPPGATSTIYTTNIESAYGNNCNAAKNNVGYFYQGSGFFGAVCCI